MQSNNLIWGYLVVIASFCGVGYFLSNVSFQSQVVPVWLPAGIALAACYLSKNKLLPAVFISSFIFNFSVGPDFSLDVLMSVVALQNAIIATGATLQAYVGSTLMLKWLDNPLNETKTKRTLSFVFVIGILVNLISANIGVTSLTTLNSFFSWDGFLLNMTYWWLGDSAGVLIATPLILAICHYREAGKEQKSTPLVIVFTLSALFIFIVLMTWLFVAKSNQNINSLVNANVKSIDNALFRQISNSLMELQQFSRRLSAHPELSEQTFNEYSSRYMAKDRVLNALSWNPVIPQSDLSQHKQIMRSIYPNVRDQATIIRGEPLTPDDFIIYVKYIYPLEPNEKALGFNVNSNHVRRQTLSLVLDSHQAAATDILQLVQTAEKRPAFLVFNPVVSRSMQTQGSLNPQLMGLATGVFVVDQIIAEAFTDENRKMFDYQLLEVGAQAPFLASNISMNEAFKADNVIELEVHVLEQRWVMKLLPKEAYLLQLKNQSFLILFLLQFAIVTIFISLILLMNNRRVGLDLMVQSRTKSLEKAVEAANQSSEAKSRFLANMSHEIRTPMNSVVGFARLASQSNSLDEVKGYVEQIGLSSDLMMNVIDDILDISKIESDKLTLNETQFDLKDLVLKIDAIYGSQSQDKGLQWSLTDELPTQYRYVGDPTRIQQVLMNLCANALKFTANGKVMMYAGIKRQQGNKSIISFAVRDTGVGMSETQLERVFEPFTQADESTSRKFGGTGLGLTITKQLCQLMGGSIAVESKLGEGTLFTVEIPLVVREAPVTQVLDKNHEQLEAVNLSPLRVLVAEDNKINQLLIVKILNNFKITPKVVDNGQLAVEQIAESEFDVILMDCQMPVMDGYEATKKIKALRPDLPIFALTADVDVASREKAAIYGFDLHIAKPIDADTLQNALATVLKT